MDTTQPRHMNVASSKYNFQLPYNTYMGGVGAIIPSHFRKINGFSNVFFGWGGEDDDLSGRIEAAGLHIKRSTAHIGRYNKKDFLRRYLGIF